MGNALNNNKPWLTADGKPLSKERLAIVGQKWSQETWDEYLDATVTSAQVEAIIEPHVYDFLCDNLSHSIFENDVRTEDVESEIATIIRKFRSTLDRIDQVIFRMRFWQAQSAAATARAVKMQARTCLAREKKILKRFAELTQKHRTVFPLVQGPSTFSVQASEGSK